MHKVKEDSCSIHFNEKLFFLENDLFLRKTFYGILTYFRVFGRDIENELTTLTFSFFIRPISLLLSCILFISKKSHILSRPTISQPSNPLLNCSSFSSLRISLSKKIGADWSLSLSLSLSLCVCW